MSAKNKNFVRIDLPPELKTEFRELAFRRNEDMTTVLNREIAEYIDRVNWEELIKSRAEGSSPPSDPLYCNEEISANEAKAKEAYSSDHIRFGLQSKSLLQKVCNLRGIVMSALIRLIIFRYVEASQSLPVSQNIDLSHTEENDFFGFNLPVDIDKKFKEACKKKYISKSCFLRLMASQYLERVKWSVDQRPINDDSEFPAREVKEEELEGEFKFTHVVLNKAEKNKIALVCRGRGVRPSSLFRLMIMRFIENPNEFRFNEQIDATRGRVTLEFSCPQDLYDLFDKTCAQTMSSASVVLKQMLIDYINRITWEGLRKKRKRKSENISSDSEFPNEEIWEEDSGGDKSVTISLTGTQKKDLERICKIRNISLSSLSRVMMGRYVVANKNNANG